MTQPIVNRFADAESVAKAAASALIDKLETVLQFKSEAHIALTGGTVGIATLAALANHADRDKIDYTKVNFWWGDERFVDSDSPDRNANQARKALLSKIQLDESKVHEFPASDEGLDLDQAAAAFALHVNQIRPHFDVVFCGVGPDGHICSLFPEKPALESGLLVFAEHNSPKPPPLRLTFTYEAVNSADEVWFVVAGADKQAAVEVAFGDSAQSLPVGRVHGTQKTVWFVDQTAGNRVWGC